MHRAAAHHYSPERAAVQDFDPFWELVSGPLNAGAFRPTALDPTFGPELVFTHHPPSLANVIGSLHSSGHIALADAAGLAAIIGACEAEEDFTGVVPLGAVATLEFLAPARGRLVASCQLDTNTRRTLHPLLTGQTDRARVATIAGVLDEADALVCRGTFEWSVRRRPGPNWSITTTTT